MVILNESFKKDDQDLKTDDDVEGQTVGYGNPGGDNPDFCWNKIPPLVSISSLNYKI